MPLQTLPFTLKSCAGAIDLQDACAVRALAYGHHLPELQDSFAQPEALDHQPGTEVLLCRDKSTRQATGSARLRFSQDGPLQIDASLVLPRWLAGQRRAEITRLAVLGGADPLTKLALMKACYQICLARGTDWMVIGARKPALIRNYQRLGFVDVLAPDDLVPLAHAANLPHRILAFDVMGAHDRWQAAGHPLFDFMVRSHHPDLQVQPLYEQLAA
jgi:hypothetical protein